MGGTQFTEKDHTPRRPHGSDLGGLFGQPEPPSHVYRALYRGPIVVTELQSRVLSRDRTPSFGYDDAYQVIVSFGDVRLDLWFNESFHTNHGLQNGRTYITDLRREPRVLMKESFHTLNFYLPIATLRAYAEQNDLPAFTEFQQSPTIGQDDPVMRQLAGAVSAAFKRDPKANGLLIDSILDAACIGLLQQYASPAQGNRARPFGLAPWQERRAKEMMAEHLDLSMSDLARECGLSVGHFSRAFKNSTGVAPHQWQMSRRIMQAQGLLAGSLLSIAEVALKCGFSSQSHFHTAFREATGLSPGRWRRMAVGREIRWDKG